MRSAAWRSRQSLLSGLQMKFVRVPGDWHPYRCAVGEGQNNRSRFSRHATGRFFRNRIPCPFSRRDFQLAFVSTGRFSGTGARCAVFRRVGHPLKTSCARIRRCRAENRRDFLQSTTRYLRAARSNRGGFLATSSTRRGNRPLPTTNATPRSLVTRAADDSLAFFSPVSGLSVSFCIHREIFLSRRERAWPPKR